MPLIPIEINAARHPEAFDFCQFLGAVTGIFGALLVGSQVAKTRQNGFNFFMMSNGFWTYWAISHSAWWLLVMQCFYVATSLRGILSNRAITKRDT